MRRLLNFVGIVPPPRRPYSDTKPATPEAEAELRSDSSGTLPAAPGLEAAVNAAAGWICRAQDNSSTNDGGVARHFSLNTGWGASYPETTGYIVQSLLDFADRCGESSGLDQTLRPELPGRIGRMLKFLGRLQFPEGGFPGGIVGEEPQQPVVFNTGQILIGLAAAADRLDQEQLTPMQAAADWLVKVQDPDGAWRKHHSPFAAAGDRSYDTHTSIGLLRAAAVSKNSRYSEAGLRNIRYCLSFQQKNGFVRSCCLTDPDAPLTHTVGYFLRGVVEGYLFSKEQLYLDRAMLTALSLGERISEDGFLGGRLNKNFKPVVPYACLTGSVQIAESMLHLYAATSDRRLLNWAAALNRYVRSTIKIQGTDGKIEGTDGVRGGIKGVYPVNGRYNAYQFLNWAAKFFIDSHLLEMKLAPPMQSVVSG